MTTFERIKQVANERGFNLKQTALIAGLSENALYRYNQGVEPKYATVKAVADVLGVSTDYLLGNTDDMHAANNEDPSTPELIAAHWGIDLDNLSKEEKAIVMARARDYVKGLVDAFESK